MSTRYTIEISPPDIEPYRIGNTGVEFVHVLDSGKPGPNVMLQALTHGNEICGAIAMDYLLRDGLRPARGRLTLAFANVAHMLRPGGLFLANNSTPVVLPASMDSVGYSETIFSGQLNDRDRIDWYRKR